VDDASSVHLMSDLLPRNDLGMANLIPVIEKRALPAVLRTTAAALALSALVACSAGTPSPAVPQATGTTVETVLGPVTVPDEVTSVVVVEGRRDLDIALSLGLPLVGYPTAADSADPSLPSPLAEPLAAATAQGARPLFARSEINVEAIAAAAPSLIISRADDVEPVLAELQAIAPVLAIGEQTTSTWQEDLLLVGRATGREERAQQLVDEHEQRVADFRATHAEALATTAVTPVSIGAEGSAVRPERLLSTVLREVGATPSRAFAAAIAAGPDGTEHGPEQLLAEHSDADALVALVNTGEEWRALQASPLWQQLPAVQQGRVVRADNATHEGGPLTAAHALDLLDQLYAPA